MILVIIMKTMMVLLFYMVPIRWHLPPLHSHLCLITLYKLIIVTGSQKPLEALRSDGQTNLLNALYLAANYPINEVTLFFNNKLFRGNRSIKSHADGFDAFTSPNCPPLIDAGIHIRCLQSCPLLKNNGNFSSHKITPQPIGVVTIYPGISVQSLRPLPQLNSSQQ